MNKHLKPSNINKVSSSKTLLDFTTKLLPKLIKTTNELHTQILKIKSQNILNDL